MSFYLKRVLPSILPCYLDVTSVGFLFTVAGLPWWLRSKESTCNAENVSSIPGSRRSPGEGYGNPLKYSCLGNPMDRGARWTRRVGHNLATKQQQHSLCVSGICKQLCWVVLAQGLSWSCSWGVCWGWIIWRLDWAGGPNFKMPHPPGWQIGIGSWWEPSVLSYVHMGRLESPHGTVASPEDQTKPEVFYMTRAGNHTPLLPPFSTGHAYQPWISVWGLYKGVKTKSQDVQDHLEAGHHNVTQS